VFSRQEFKDIILKKWIFPDFSNKVTWFVVGLGGAVILTPTPLKQLFYNWLVDTLNLNSGNHYTLAELQSNSADYWLGFGLILLALIHNIGYRVFIYKSDKFEKEEHEKIVQVDKVLYQEFVKLLPSDGISIGLLKEHDFGGSYHKNKTNDLETFIYTWNNSQKQFLDSELELERAVFFQKINQFTNTLALHSYNIGGSMFSCIPDLYRGGDWPPHVQEQIKELNTLASDCFEKHTDLVLAARRKLKC